MGSSAGNDLWAKDRNNFTLRLGRDTDTGVRFLKLHEQLEAQTGLPLLPGQVLHWLLSRVEDPVTKAIDVSGAR